jgi:hypothetical protein
MAIAPFDEMVQRSWRVLVPTLGFTNWPGIMCSVAHWRCLAAGHRSQPPSKCPLYTLDDGLLKATELVEVAASRGIRS